MTHRGPTRVYTDQERKERGRIASRVSAQRKRDANTALGLLGNGAERTGPDWDAIIPEAARIVQSYDTGVTLRQLFYQLVARQLIPNTGSAYEVLGQKTAKGRRAETFPHFIETGRRVHTIQSFADPAEARRWLRGIYRRDRTEGQDKRIMLGVEKGGMIPQLQSWFEDLGVPIFSTSGYSSVTLEKRINMIAGTTGATLIYAGDFDPSGEDIVRNLEVNLPNVAIDHIALTEDQVAEFNLPENYGKETDSRAAGFVARHGRLVQVELDALAPTDLRALYQEAIDQYWSTEVYEASLAREAEDRARL